MTRTKTQALFDLLSNQWVTPLDALRVCRVMTLAQRVSEWRAEGHVIADKWVKSASGSRYKAYRLVKRVQR
jgi:hypothetical protein